jgi:serine phosphatase RsbU (regulator of sigma subunit)
MGVIYFTQKLYDKALEVHLNQLERVRKLDAKPEIARSLNNIGNVYNILAEDSLKSLFGENFQDSVKIESSDKYLKLFDEALRYYNESLEVHRELGDINGVLDGLVSLGIIYVYSGKPAMALGALEEALELNKEINSRRNQATIDLLLGQVYTAFENYNTALDYLNSSLELALETETKEIVMEIYGKLSEVYEKQNNYVQALKYYKLYFATNDSLTQEDQRKAIADMQVKYETEATEKENALLLAQSELDAANLKRTRAILIITIIAIGIFIVMMIELFRQNNLKKKANRELEQKNDLITEQKKEITDSIQYASRIQNAMLPPGDYIDSLMPERFIIYMPRDIVSGDYYYITEKEDKIICVAADCTGHGVPGAFMSMLGIAFLNEIISKHAELHTDEILGELRTHVIASLHQTGKEGESQDGMDLALYILDPETRKIEFSGANNSLLVFRNGEMIEAKADKMPIGIHKRYKEPFARHNLELQKGDVIYTYTDGYPDQFGGPNQKKFMIKNFKKLLQEIHNKPMYEQKDIMERTLRDWMANTDQIDDILVIGVRI